MLDSIYSHWDIASVIFYVIIGIICAICFYSAKNKELKTGKKQSLLSLPYLICIFTLTIVAAFRHIAPRFGGTDASLYKTFFENCLSDNLSSYYQHYDVLYKLINCTIRFFTSNYYIFATIFYGFISICFVYFVNEFLEPKDSKIPLILVFYLYLRGFNTYRTELTIAIILLSFCFYKKDKRVLAYILAFLTFFIHKAAIIYAASLIFLDVFKKRKIKIKYCFLFIILSYVIAKYFQPILIEYFTADTTNVYSSYIKRSLRRDFFTDYWKICFEQLVLLLIMIIFRSAIIDRIEKCKNYLKEKNLLWQLCIYDFILIPVTYILGIWRGYEYLYLPRIIMFGMAVRILIEQCDRNLRLILNILILIIVISWMVFRIYNTWESSSLLPYVFDPFYNGI